MARAMNSKPDFYLEEIFLYIAWLIAKLFIVTLLSTRIWSYISTPRYKNEKQLKNKIIVMVVDRPGPMTKMVPELIGYGARVIVGCPDVHEMLQIFPGERFVKVREFDSSNFASVKTFANRILKEEKKIDILINDCEKFERMFILSANRYDLMQQSIYLAPVLLTEMLLPLLKKSAPSKIIFSGSLNLLAGHPETDMRKAYNHPRNKYRLRHADAHYSLFVYVRALTTEFKNAGIDITVNIAHAGVAYVLHDVANRHIGKLGALMIELFCGGVTKDGYHSHLYLCMDPTISKETGQFIFGCCRTPDFVLFSRDKTIETTNMKNTRKLLRPRRK